MLMFLNIYDQINEGIYSLVLVVWKPNPIAQCQEWGDLLRSIPWPKLGKIFIFCYNEVVNHINISVRDPYWWNKVWATYFLFFLDFRAHLMVGCHTVTNRYFISYSKNIIKVLDLSVHEAVVRLYGQKAF